MKKFARKLIKDTQHYLVTGLIVLLPLLLTVYALVLLFILLDGFLGKFIEPVFFTIFGFYYDGISIVVFLILVYVIGFLIVNFFGKKLYPYLERLLVKVPFFREIYPSMKEIALFLFSRDKPTFKQVVLVEYPRKGAYALGFLMSDDVKKISKAVNREVLSILIPTSPSPFSGFVALIPREEVVFTDITVEQAIKFLVSDGVVIPQ